MRSSLLAALFLATIALTVGQTCNSAYVSNGQATYINSSSVYQQVLTCTFFHGLIISGGDLTGDLSFPALQTIDGQGTNQGIQVLNTTGVTSVTFGSLTSYGGALLRIIQNSNLTTVTIGGANSISTTGSSTPAMTIQNNGALTSTTINFANSQSLILGGTPSGATTNSGINGASGNVSFPFLQTSSPGGIKVQQNNNGAGLVAINFPVLTSASSFSVTENSLTSIYVPSSIAVASTVTVQNNPNLSSFILNLVSSPTINIGFCGNANNPWSINFDGISNTASLSAGGLNLLNLNGLTSFSAQNLRYISTVVLSNLPQLTYLNLPSGIIVSTSSGVSISSVGSNAVAILGFQNVSTFSLQTGSFSNISFPYLTQVVSAFTINTQFTNGVVSFPTAFTVGSAFSISSTGSLNSVNADGLISAGSIQILSNSFGGQGTLSFRGLQSLSSTGIQSQISSNSGLTSVVFGALRNVGLVSGSPVQGVLAGLLVNSNSGLTTFSTAASSNTPNYVSEAMLFLSNGALTSIDLSGLVQVGNLTITGGHNNLKTINAANLACASNITTDSALTSLTTFNLNGLANSGYSRLSTNGAGSGTVGSCTVDLPGGNTDCRQTCTDCLNTGICSSSFTPLASPNPTCSTTPFSASCPAAAAYSTPTNIAAQTPSSVPAANPSNNNPSNSGTTTSNNNNNNNGNPSAANPTVVLSGTNGTYIGTVAPTTSSQPRASGVAALVASASVAIFFIVLSTF